MKTLAIKLELSADDLSLVNEILSGNDKQARLWLAFALYKLSRDKK